MTSDDLSNIIVESINSVDLDKLKNEKNRIMMRVEIRNCCLLRAL